MLPFDSEFAYRRCLEIMGQLETEAPEQPRTRSLILDGPWRRPRKYVECYMYVRLFDCVARGVTLDEMILAELEPFANFRVSPLAQPRLIVRPPATSQRNGEVSFTELHTAGVPAIRNEAIDVDSGNDNLPFVL